MTEKKTVIVAETSGTERHYNADNWIPGNDGALDLTREGTIIAAYPPGTWRCVRDSDAAVPDPARRKLGTATLALREILAINVPGDGLDGAGARAGVATLREIARLALEDIAAQDL